MQYDDEANRTTDPNVDETDRTAPQSDLQQPESPEWPPNSGDAGEAVAEYSVVEESVVEQPDEQADATHARDGGTTKAADTIEPAARTDDDDPFRARWHAAQHLFVDDPAGAVHEAAALVQEAAERATSATQAESGTDRGAQSGPDTERLRITMRRYHEAFESLIGISSGVPS